jgi:hypothetical protein
MKTILALILSCLALGPGAAGAAEWTVRMKAVEGRVTYSHTQESPIGEQVSFAGKPLTRGGGPARELIFNTFLNKPEDGFLRLDYQVELGGAHRARPPFQAQGKVLLRPGKPVIAAEAGGWKFILELQGEAGGKPRGGNPGRLETVLKCGRTSYPANFVYLPEEQYSAVLYGGTDDEVRRFMVGLLPNISALDGTFLLQYTLQLKEGSETLADGKGELVLAPGAGRASAAAGKGCVFSAKALR